MSRGIVVDFAVYQPDREDGRYSNEPICVRVGLEYNFKPRHEDKLIAQAVELLNGWRKLFPHIKGADCYMKHNMKLISTDWPSTDIELHGDYAHFPIIKHFPWIPRIYARRNNFRIIQENADIIKSKTEAIAIDYI